MAVISAGMFMLYVDAQATEFPQDCVEIGRLL
jgi:hypothetical protein